MRPFVHEIIDSPGRPWRVVCVCDADGSGRNFAYTVGLEPMGLPELLVWARPTDGEDPGADWRFSHRDLASVLHDLSDLLISGDLMAGTTLARPADAGLATVMFRVRVETVAGALDVPGLTDSGDVALAEDCFVLPVGWSLRRPTSRAPGDPTGGAAAARPTAGAASSDDLAVMLGAALGAARTQTDRIQLGITNRGGRLGRVPRAWRQGPTPTPSHRFGPLHGLVVNRGEQVLLSDAWLLARFVDATFDIGDDAPGEVLGPMSSLAAATGRLGVPDAVELAADEVTTLLVGRHRPTVRWRQAWPPQRQRVGPANQRLLEPFARSRLLLHVHGLLAAEAFADMLAPVLLERGRASWLTAIGFGD
jgi:hypothetical protein